MQCSAASLIPNLQTHTSRLVSRWCRAWTTYFSIHNPSPFIAVLLKLDFVTISSVKSICRLFYRISDPYSIFGESWIQTRTSPYSNHLDLSQQFLKPPELKDHISVRDLETAIHMPFFKGFIRLREASRSLGDTIVTDIFPD